MNPLEWLVCILFGLIFAIVNAALYITGSERGRRDAMVDEWLSVDRSKRHVR